MAGGVGIGSLRNSEVDLLHCHGPAIPPGMRKHIPALIALYAFGLAGCSNAPIAGTMDTLFPSKVTRTRNPDPRDLFDRDRDPLPPPDLRSRDRDRDDSLPPPRNAGELQSNPRTEPERPLRGDPFRPHSTDPGEPLPPPLPAPGFLDPIGPGRN